MNTSTTSKEKDYKEIVKKRFEEIESIDDFSSLLQFIYEKIILKQEPNKDTKKGHVVFKTKYLTYYAYILKNGEGYYEFKIPKKKGGSRVLNSPKLHLKLIQHCILELIYILYVPHKAANGFILGKSVATNARNHVGKKYVFNIDIKDFFPSTTIHKIQFLLTLKPFNLAGNKEIIGRLIANLCCMKGFLPQGAPTSPAITNIVCRRIDAKLSKLAFENNSKYSRYADDITFSSNKNIFNDIFIKQIEDILKLDKYEINPDKTRLSKWNERQEVTGIVVNKKTNLPRTYTKEIRFWLHIWEKFGEIAAQSRFEIEYQKKGILPKYTRKVNFKNYLFGKISYLAIVKGKKAEDVIAFIQAFNALNKDKKSNIKVSIEKNNTQSTDFNFLESELKKIREVLEIRGDYSIDYSFIKSNNQVKKQLMVDNLKMENVALVKLNSHEFITNENERFSEFCRYAYFQIELILNLYYLQRFEGNLAKVNDFLRTQEMSGKMKKQDGKPYTVYAKKDNTNSIEFKMKLDIFYKTFDLNMQGNLYKGLEAILEVRNTQVSHRGALEENNISTNRYMNNTNVKKDLKEIIIGEHRFDIVRDVVTEFVKEINNYYFKIV